MTRFARVVAVGVPHHVTQRGNARQYILDADADRKVYLDFVVRRDWYLNFVVRKL
jgi:putative transposase